jgi:hypothetical protein
VWSFGQGAGVSSEGEKWYATVNWMRVDGFVYLCDDPEVIAATQRNIAAGPSVQVCDKVFAMCNSDFDPVTLRICDMTKYCLSYARSACLLFYRTIHRAAKVSALPSCCVSNGQAARTSGVEPASTQPFTNNAWLPLSNKTSGSGQV